MSGDSAAELRRLLQEENELSQQIRAIESHKIEWEHQLRKLHNNIARGLQWCEKNSLHSHQIFRGVQKTDEQKTRVDNLSSIVNSLIKLNAALDRLNTDISDIGQSCETFGRILSNLHNETFLERAWHSRNLQKHGISLSKTLDGIRLELKQRLLHELSHLTFVNDMDGAMLRAFEYLRLLQLIGAQEEAISQMRSTLHQVCSSSLNSITESPLVSIDFAYSIKISKCIEYATGFAGWCHRRISLTPFVDSQAMSLIVDEVILRQDLPSAIISIIKTFLEQGRIKDCVLLKRSEGQKSPNAPNAPMDIREMDLIVAEISFVIQNAATIRIESSSLDYILSELSQTYVLLEGSYLRLGVKKALEMNEIQSDSSTAIEDTLFILRKCIQRCRGVKSNAPSSIIAEAKSALKSDLLACLMRRTKVELRAPDNLYIVANDCLGAVRLIDSLTEDDSQSQIAAEFVGVKESFEGCRKACIESIYNKDIKTKSPLANLPRELGSFMILPVESHEEERAPSPLHNLISWWKQKQSPESAWLCVLWPQNVKSLIDLYLQDCANIVERAITNYSKNPSVSHQRWLDLERDIRKIIIFFNEPTEYSAKFYFEKVMDLLAALIE